MGSKPRPVLHWRSASAYLRIVDKASHGEAPGGSQKRSETALI
jgi:hypothetical protein